MSRLARIADIIDRLNEQVGRGVAWLLLAMVLVQFAVVVLRYVFALGFAPAREAIWYMNGTMFMLAAGYTLLKDGHVRLDVFYREASPQTKAIVDLAGAAIFLVPLCVATLWLSWSYVTNSWRVLEGSSEFSGLPLIFLLKTVIWVFALLLGLQGVAMAIRAGLLVAGSPAEDDIAGGASRRRPEI